MSDVVVTREGALSILRLNRAEKKNALTGAMYTALTAGLTEANADESVGAIVILGQPGIFCAGNDIKDFIGFAMGGGIGHRSSISCARWWRTRNRWWRGWMARPSASAPR